MLNFCSLYSGSSGNSLFVETDNTKLLIDAGVSSKKIEKALNDIDVDPSSLDGILNAAILSIGRAIGESAALVFAMGTLITAAPSLTSSNTSLAVHIWYILSGEHPAYGQACAISIMILCVVLVLSIISKVIPILLNKRKTKGVKQNVKPIQK